MTDEAAIRGCRILVAGSIGACLLVNTDYRVTEIIEHWEPTGVEGEPPVVTTVITFEPVDAAERARLLAALPEALREIHPGPAPWPGPMTSEQLAVCIAAELPKP